MSDAVIKAEKLVLSFLKGKEVHDLFAKEMQEKLTINGQKLNFWKDHFHIDIPYTNLNPAICKDIDIMLLKLNQEAALYYALANTRVETMGRANETLYGQRFNAIVQEYKQRNEKLPAHATLEMLANAENDEIESAKSQFEIEKVFWKDILDHLSTIRKIVENITWNHKNDLDIKYAKDYGA